MKPDAAIRMVRKLASLFANQVTTEHSKLLVKEFQPFSEHAVEKAIREHRTSPDLKDGFMNIGKLLEGCRAAERGADLSARAYVPDQSTAAIYRKMRPDLRGANDFEVMIRIHRGWYQANARWDEAAKTKVISEGYQRGLERGLKSALCACGMKPEEADHWLPYLALADRDCQSWLDEVRQLTPIAAENQGQASAA